MWTSRSSAIGLLRSLWDQVEQNHKRIPTQCQIPPSQGRKRCQTRRRVCHPTHWKCLSLISLAIACQCITGAQTGSATQVDQIPIAPTCKPHREVGESNHKVGTCSGRGQAKLATIRAQDPEHPAKRASTLHTVSSSGDPGVDSIAGRVTNTLDPTARRTTCTARHRVCQCRSQWFSLGDFAAFTADIRSHPEEFDQPATTCRLIAFANANGSGITGPASSNADHAKQSICTRLSDIARTTRASRVAPASTPCAANSRCNRRDTAATARKLELATGSATNVKHGYPKFYTAEFSRTCWTNGRTTRTTSSSASSCNVNTSHASGPGDTSWTRSSSDHHPIGPCNWPSSFSSSTGYDRSSPGSRRNRRGGTYCTASPAVARICRTAEAVSAKTPGNSQSAFATRCPSAIRNRNTNSNRTADWLSQPGHHDDCQFSSRSALCNKKDTGVCYVTARTACAQGDQDSRWQCPSTTKYGSSSSPRDFRLTSRVAQISYANSHGDPHGWVRVGLVTCPECPGPSTPDAEWIRATKDASLSSRSPRTELQSKVQTSQFVIPLWEQGSEVEERLIAGSGGSYLAAPTSEFHLHNKFELCTEDRESHCTVLSLDRLIPMTAQDKGLESASHLFEQLQQPWPPESMAWNLDFIEELPDLQPEIKYVLRQLPLWCFSCEPIAAVHIYVDGSSFENRQTMQDSMAAWAFIIMIEHVNNEGACHSFYAATSHCLSPARSNCHQFRGVGELTTDPASTESVAMIMAMAWIAQSPFDCPHTIHFDSCTVGYFAAGESQWNAGWEHATLRQNITALRHCFQAVGYDVRFAHVKAHEGHPLNEAVDALAKATAKRIVPPFDLPCLVSTILLNRYMPYAWISLANPAAVPTPFGFRGTFLAEGPFPGQDIDTTWRHPQPTEQVDAVTVKLTVATANVLTLNPGSKSGQLQGLLQMGRIATLSGPICSGQNPFHWAARVPNTKASDEAQQRSSCVSIRCYTIWQPWLWIVGRQTPAICQNSAPTILFLTGSFPYRQLWRQTFAGHCSGSTFACESAGSPRTPPRSDWSCLSTVVGRHSSFDHQYMQSPTLDCSWWYECQIGV